MYFIAERDAISNTIEVIGEFDPKHIEEPTLEEKIDARFAYIEMMTGLLEE
jgi:hypothetical protein